MPKLKDTKKTLKDTLADIDSQFGKGTVMRMGDREILDIHSISTGSLTRWEYSFVLSNAWIAFPILSSIIFILLLC